MCLYVCMCGFIMFLVLVLFCFFFLSFLSVCVLFHFFSLFFPCFSFPFISLHFTHLFVFLLSHIFFFFLFFVCCCRCCFCFVVNQRFLIFRLFAGVATFVNADETKSFLSLILPPLIMATEESNNTKQQQKTLIEQMKNIKPSEHAQKQGQYENKS